MKRKITLHTIIIQGKIRHKYHKAGDVECYKQKKNYELDFEGSREVISGWEEITLVSPCSINSHSGGWVGVFV